MKRSTFLRMLGLAPVAAALPAMALPRPEKPIVDCRGADPEAIAKLERDVRNHLIELHRALPKHIGINFNRELHEHTDGDRIIREGGKRHYTVSF